MHGDCTGGARELRPAWWLADCAPFRWPGIVVGASDHSVQVELFQEANVPLFAAQSRLVIEWSKVNGAPGAGRSGGAGGEARR